MTTLRVLIAGFVLLAATLTAGAQQWPNRPVRFIVPFPAGGSTDVGARVIGEFLSRSLHQQIVVENKSGANGSIAIEAAAKSAADGYTILVSTEVLSSTRSSQFVCRRKPGEPCRRSPSRMVSVSPARR